MVGGTRVSSEFALLIRSTLMRPTSMSPASDVAWAPRFPRSSELRAATSVAEYVALRSADLTVKMRSVERSSFGIGCLPARDVWMPPSGPGYDRVQSPRDRVDRLSWVGPHPAGAARQSEAPSPGSRFGLGQRFGVMNC